MTEVDVTMAVNGKKVSHRTEPHRRLLDFLRDDLNLTGTKEGCGEGECGTCSVIVNGSVVKSCLTLVPKVDGAEIVTVEGLSENGVLTPVQQSFVEAGASQCGFCIPGMVVTVTGLLNRNTNPTPEEIRHGLSGNICRCTGYGRIFEAVELARDRLAGVDSGQEPLSVGQEVRSFMGAPVLRTDAPSKVTGAIKYAADMRVDGMLYVSVLRSPHPHALIRSLEVGRAESFPGVEAVLTWRDVIGEDGHGVFVDDQPVFAKERVRFLGEGIAAVVAQTQESARAALHQIHLEYEPLTGAFSPTEALSPGAPLLHEAFPGNLLRHVKIRKGDVDAAFARAALVIEETYKTQPVEHAYLEPESGLGYLEADGTLTIVSPSQNVTHHRRLLAKITGLPVNKVRCIMSPVGGGFGGKEDMTVQPVLALAVLRTRQPVKYVFSREESFICSAKRHPFEIRYRSALSGDGLIIASECEALADGGAYAFSSPGVMVKAAALANGPYRIDNVRVDVRVAYTNNTPSGAMRGFGATQMHFATECHMDLCASRLGMDPLRFRELNALRDGDSTHTGQVLASVSLLKTIEEARRASQWQDEGKPSWSPDPHWREKVRIGEVGRS